MVARDIERLSAPRHPAPRVNPNVREGLPLRMRCEVGAATIANDSPVGDVGSGGGCVNARQRYVDSVLSARFCWEPKTGL